MLNFASFLILAFTTLSLSPASALANNCGIFKVVKQNVTFKKKNKTKFKNARVNKKICSGDIVKTGKDSRAKVVLSGGDEISLSPNTEVIIAKLSGKKDNKKVLLDVIYGKIRSNVKQKYKDNDASHYRVRTKSAVAGVRGTEFLAGFNPRTKQSRIVTFRGQVAVGHNNNGAYKIDVIVKAGHSTRNTRGHKPHLPLPISPQELAKIDSETQMETTIFDTESDRGVSSKPQQEIDPEASPGTEQPKDGDDHTREPSSVDTDIDRAVDSIEESISHENVETTPEIDFTEAPSLPKLIDGGNITGAPDFDQPDVIDNVIQNPKANVIFNIEVQ